MPVSIRIATVEDIESLVQLNNAVQTLHASVEPDIFRSVCDYQELRDFFGKGLGNTQNVMAIAEKD